MVLKFIQNLMTRTSLLQSSGKSWHGEEEALEGNEEAAAEHPLAPILLDEAGRMASLTPGKLDCIRLNEGEFEPWRQALSAYRTEACRSRHNESLATSLQKFAQAAIEYQLRVLGHFAVDMGQAEKEAIAASILRYWRMETYVGYTAYGRLTRTSEFPGRLFNVIGLRGIDLQNWFSGEYPKFWEAWLELVMGIHFDCLPHPQMSVAQKELMLRFIEHHGPKLRLIASSPDPKATFAHTLEAAVLSTGTGGIIVQKCHLDTLSLKALLLDLTGTLRKSGIPAYLEGFTTTPAILASLVLPFLTHWSFFRQTRKLERLEENRPIEVVLGLDDIICALKGEGRPTIHAWYETDHHGKGLSAHSNTLNADFQPGCIIGIRIKGQCSWSVGVIRRLIRNKDRRYVFGIELLKDAVPTTCKPERSGNELACLIWEQKVILPREKLTLGLELDFSNQAPPKARNFRIGEVGANFEMHLLEDD